MNARNTEEIFDLLVKQACREYAEAETDEILEKYKQSEIGVPSTIYKKRIKKLAAASNRQAFRVTSGRRLFVIVAVIILVSIMAASVSANAPKWFDFFVQSETDTHISFGIEEKSELRKMLLQEVPTSWEYVYIPTEPLLNNASIGIQVYDTVMTLTMETDYSWLVFTQANYINKSFTLDSERGPATPININGMVGYSYESDEGNSLTWLDEEYMLSISSNFSVEQLVFFAENVKKTINR